MLLDGVYPDGFPMPNLGRDPAWSVLKPAPVASDCASSEKLVEFFRANRPDLDSSWGEYLRRDILDHATFGGMFDPISAFKRRALFQQQLLASLPSAWPDFEPFRGAIMAIVPNGTSNPLCPPNAPNELRERADRFYRDTTLPWIRVRTECLRKAKPEAKIVLLDESNHAAFLPKPDLVAHHIRSFCEQGSAELGGAVDLAMTPRDAINFIRYHGVVLEGSKGLEPSLAAKVAGEPISGSWWGHPKGHEIYELTEKVRDSQAVLVCTLAGDKITYIHRRLWPAFVRVADEFQPAALNSVQEIHTSSGRHQRHDVPFPQWVPRPILASAKMLSRVEARAQIEVWLQRYGAQTR